MRRLRLPTPGSSRFPLCARSSAVVVHWRRPCCSIRLIRYALHCRKTGRKGKTVMAGNEIHGCVLPVMVRIYISGAGDSQGSRLRHALVPLDMAAHIVPVPAVPLCPAVPGREGPHLIKTVRIPCLGYELDIAQNGVKGKTLKQGSLLMGAPSSLRAMMEPDQSGTRQSGRP